MVSVLLSASVERCFVSCMWDFFVLVRLSISVERFFVSCMQDFLKVVELVDGGPTLYSFLLSSACYLIVRLLATLILLQFVYSFEEPPPPLESVEKSFESFEGGGGPVGPYFG